MIKASDSTEEGGGSCAPLGGSGHVKHTPAPWKAVKGNDGEPERWIVVAGGAKQWHIAVIENGQPGDCLETEGATAHLIAASPELLDVADAWSKATQLSGVSAVKDSNDPIESLLFRTRAAIQKASGQNDGTVRPPGTSGAEGEARPNE